MQVLRKKGLRLPLFLGTIGVLLHTVFLVIDLEFSWRLIETGRSVQDAFFLETAISSLCLFFSLACMLAACIGIFFRQRGDVRKGLRFAVLLRLAAGLLDAVRYFKSVFNQINISYIASYDQEVMVRNWLAQFVAGVIVAAATLLFASTALQYTGQKTLCAVNAVACLLALLCSWSLGLASNFFYLSVAIYDQIILRGLSRNVVTFMSSIFDISVISMYIYSLLVNLSLFVAFFSPEDTQETQGYAAVPAMHAPPAYAPQGPPYGAPTALAAPGVPESPQGNLPPQ